MEEWGVETGGTGTAAYTFDAPSGAYNIRISYFDEENGHGHVTLRVAGEEKAVFTLDEDTDCWRHRTFENIPVRNGDEIQLVGRADTGEKVKLDYVEFIPVRH